MKQSDRKSQSRKRILEAAREVFFREDYMGASVDEIAQVAGISKGAIYRYFPNKAALYVTILAENGKTFSEGVEERVERTREMSSADRIRNLWSAYLEYWIRNPDHFRIFWAIDNEAVIGEIPKELAEGIPDFWQRTLQLTQGVLDEGVERGEFIPCDTWQTAQTIWTVATALIEHDNTKGRRKIRQRPLREMYDHSIEIVLRGILVDQAESRLSQQAGIRAAEAERGND